jgi:hypothetical protein
MASYVQRRPIYREESRMDITNLLDDDTLVSFSDAGTCLGKPGKPLSRRTISRMANKPDGLPFIEIGGRKWIRLSAIRELVRQRERHPNRRRRRQ